MVGVGEVSKTTPKALQVKRDEKVPAVFWYPLEKLRN